MVDLVVRYASHEEACLDCRTSVLSLYQAAYFY